MPLFIDPNAPNRAATLTNPIGLVDKYLRDRSAEAYKTRASDWQRQQLEDANAARIAALAARDAEIERQRAVAVAAQQKLIDDAASTGATSRKLEREKYLKWIADNNGDVAEAARLADTFEATQDAAARKKLVEDKVLSYKKEKKDPKKVIAFAEALNGLSKIGRPQTAGGFSGSGSTGVMNGDYLAKVFDDRVIKEAPEYMDVGDDAYIDKLREGEGIRASIEAQLPKFTDATDKALADAQERKEDRLAKVQLKSVLAKEKNITDAATKWKQWETDAAWEQQKLERTLASREGIARGHDINAANISAGKNMNDLRIQQMRGTIAELTAEIRLKGDMAKSPMAQSPEVLAKMIELANLQAEYSRYAQARANSAYGLDPTYGGKGIAPRVRTVPASGGLVVPGLGRIGGEDERREIVNDTLDIATLYPPKAKRAEVKSLKTSGAIDNPAKFTEWKSLVGNGVTEKNNGDGTTTFTFNGKSHTYKNPR